MLVMLVEEAIDGRLEVDDGVEDAAFQSSLGELGKKAFDGIEPRARRRREVEGEALVTGQPGPNLGMLVSGVIIEDYMHDLAGRYFRLDGVQEADELLMAVTLHVAPDHRPIEDISAAKSVVVPWRL